MLLNAIYAQIAVLVIAGLWIALSDRRSLLDSLIKLLAVTLLLLGLWFGGVWVYPPPLGLLIAALVLAGLLVLHLRKARVATSLSRTVLANVPLLVLVPLGSFLLWEGVAGRAQPSGAVIALSSPFKSEERACVLSGGVNPLLNFHNFTSDNPRDIAQTYGLDLIMTGPIGFRIRGGHRLDPKPSEIQNYVVFDAPVYAPCSGKVVEQHNDLPDQPIGASDKTYTGGNGVVLQCAQTHVHLHHMKQGSVLPQLGEEIEVGQKIGQIGNSGNTIEPHLHLHAETVVEEGNTQLHGKPVHMSFGGRFMARGDCL